MRVNATTNDDDLLQACRHGDADAFGIFYARYRSSVLAYFARRVAQPELAADLMAETFARLLVETLSRRPLPEMPTAWLFTAARNLLVDSARRGRAESAARRKLGLPPLPLDDDDIERILEIAEATELLREIRAHVSPEAFEVLRARLIDEEPYAELAQRLECSEAVVRKRLSRAVADLRTTIGERDA